MTPEEIQQRTREVFRQEAAELLRDLELGLLDLEEHPEERDVIDRVFRVMHTLKGAGATSGYKGLSTFVHRIEDVYNGAREGKLTIGRALIDLTLAAKDVIERGLEVGVDRESDHFKQESGMLERFGAFLVNENRRDTEVESRSTDVKVLRKGSITFKALPGIWMSGVDIGVFWDDLRALGRCSIAADAGDLPTWTIFDPEKCYLSWQIELETAASEKEVREVFAFAADDAEIAIEWEDKPKALEKGTAKERDVLRVGSAKVDRLVNLVGELVILRAQLQTACSRLGEVSPALAAVDESLRRLSDEMREVVLEIRMMPVGDVFGKFRRVVRDLAQEMGKEVDWVVEGGETEMDKTLLDQLADPLLHMVRNSIDHGLETPAVREQGGKPRRGTLTLKAEQRGDRVCIAVKDDGRGLDADRIRRKAIEKGLISADDPRSGSSLYELVFLPGFSTVDTVSQLSGRGVGMDVVRRRIEALRGTVDLLSEAGRGTEVRMSLPLTLAIVDGLLVEVGGESYILPLGAARETVQMPAAERRPRDRGQIVEVRGEWLPYVRLRSVFEVAGEAQSEEKVVVVQTESATFGIVVDRVVGQYQTVLKSLGWVSQRVKVFSGGTVMGDGRVALVIDVPSLQAVLSQAGRDKQVA